MRNYGRLAERSKAAVLKTVDVQASGGSNPSPSASATSSGLKRYKKEHAPACSCFCIAYCLALRFAANSGIEMVTTHSVRLFRPRVARPYGSLPSANASGCGSRRSQKGSLAQVPLPILFRTLPRPSLRYNIVHRNGDDSLRSSIPSSRRSSLRIPAFRQRCELRLEAIQKRACMRDRKIKRQFKYLRFDIWGKLLI